MKKRIKTVLTSLGFLAAFLLLVAASSENGSNQNGNKWIAPAFAKSIKNPLKGDKSSVKLGKELYVQQCATCHGESGTGNGPSARFLEKHPRNFTEKEFKSQADGEIFWKITTGNPPMPSFKGMLTKEQRWQLVNYIRTFSKK
ncbi:cytochrome c6 [bacterium BMS3Abin03]|nr:cytochrome c6 [bacterium BMS3Abin03]